jgi:transposase InsO family protein
MWQAGLAGRAPRRWKKTTIPDPAAAARADGIRRDFTADAAKINQRWCGDITYIATWEGWLYLATVIDIASRRVVGFALADHLRTELVADALANAVAARDPKFFRLAQRRADRYPGVAQLGRGLPGDRGVHRLVQRHPAAQHPGLPQPRRLRKRPLRKDQECSLTELSALSVKAGQPHIRLATESLVTPQRAITKHRLRGMLGDTHEPE